MLRAICFLMILLSLPAVAVPQAKTDPAKTPPANESTGRLPVKRVVLYKNGIGYFEHSTRIHGNQDLTIDFTTMQDVLRRVLDQKNLLTSLETQLRSRQQEVDSITKDQARLRENMKALKGSVEERALLQPYTRQLDSQEDGLNTLNKEAADLEEKRTQGKERLDRMIQDITMDQSL